MPIESTVATMTDHHTDRRLRVLLIDDEPFLLNVLRRSLAKRYTVVIAAGGAEALSVLEHDRDFDAVVCDIRMAGVDGTQVYDFLCRTAPELAARTVFCTGGTLDPRTRAFAMSVTNPVLLKPTSASELRDVVSRVINSAGPRVRPER